MTDSQFGSVTENSANSPTSFFYSKKIEDKTEHMQQFDLSLRHA